MEKELSELSHCSSVAQLVYTGLAHRPKFSMHVPLGVVQTAADHSARRVPAEPLSEADCHAACYLLPVVTPTTPRVPYPLHCLIVKASHSISSS
jgi:hypothetical protein